MTAPRPTAWAINRILALLFVLGPPEGAHAVLLLDRAGWHTTSKLVVPDNITPIFLPSRAPELNPVENIWQYLRQNWLANTVFENYDAIVDAARDAVAKAHRLPRTDHYKASGTNDRERRHSWSAIGRGSMFTPTHHEASSPNRCSSR